MRTLVRFGCFALLLGCSDSPSGPHADAPAIPRPRLFHDWTILPASAVEMFAGYGSYNLTSMSPNGVFATGTLSNLGNDVVIRATIATGVLHVFETPFGSFPDPQDVNDLGMGAGIMHGSGVFWPSVSTEPVLLPPLAGDVVSVATALTNEANPTVVGYSYSSGGVSRAVKWVLAGPAFNTPTAVELSSPGALESAANSVNAAAGAIVGHVIKSPGGMIAARWDLSTGVLEELNVAGNALDVNSSGVVVGETSASGGFIKDGAAVALMAGAPFYAVNDEGFVVGTKTGQGFIWSGMADDSIVRFWTSGAYTASDFLDISNDARVLAMSFGALPFDPDAPLSNVWVLNFNLIPDDADDDAITASSDNCPNRANADQADVDADGIGNVCDPDSPPVFTLASANRLSAREGAAVRFSSSAFDPGGRALFYSWSFSDGAVLPKAVVTRAMGNPGTFNGTATASNHAGGVTTANVNVTVTNQLPAVTFTIRNQAGEAPAVGRSGAVTTIDVRADDAGPTEQLAVLVTWVRDVTTSHTCNSPCSFSLDHTYFAPRNYKIAIAVTDANGGIRNVSLPYDVLRRTLNIDVWPGNASTIIDLDDPAHAEILVAVVGSATFDVTTLANNVTLSDGTGTPVSKLGALPVADVNGDGHPDRVYRFSRGALVAAGNLTLTASALVINGRLAGGAFVQGVTAISVVP